MKSLLLATALLAPAVFASTAGASVSPPAPTGPAPVGFTRTTLTDTSASSRSRATPGRAASRCGSGTRPPRAAPRPAAMFSPAEQAAGSERRAEPGALDGLGSRRHRGCARRRAGATRSC